MIKVYIQNFNNNNKSKHPHRDFNSYSIHSNKKHLFDFKTFFYYKPNAYFFSMKHLYKLDNELVF